MYRQTKAEQPRVRKGWNRNGSSRRRGFGGGNNYGQRNRRSSGKKIDINLFINEAAPIEPAKILGSENSIEDLKIDQRLKQAITERNYKKLTPIQDKTIPFILKGRDIIGLANTGTGKTAAFLIPLIHQLLSNPKEKALVVVPTRELATQIEEEFYAFVKKLNLQSVVIVGGASAQRQISQLRKNPRLVIGTPGRLKDLISRKNLVLTNFSKVVLDEADRMLDMGFINDVKMLLSLVSSERQTMLFSATLPKEIESLVQQFLTNPEKISFKTKETSKQIQQDIVRIQPGKNKDDILHDLLKQSCFDKVLIFTRTKRGADNLSRSLHSRGFKADAIHGDKPHSRRQRVLKMFKSNAFTILVATDVAARGLDIPNVSHVINYDIPENYDDYIHRIGRTGRADQAGNALTLIG
ncbi:MAG: DEAD/DEAH box helicase [Patescibacteria group bacterium]